MTHYDDMISLKDVKKSRMVVIWYKKEKDNWKYNHFEEAQVDTAAKGYPQPICSESKIQQNWKKFEWKSEYGYLMTLKDNTQIIIDYNDVPFHFKTIHHKHERNKLWLQNHLEIE